MTKKTQETIGETLDRLTGTNYTNENNMSEDVMTEDEANKRLKEAAHQISKAVCLLKVARDSIDYVTTKMDWDIEALYDVDEAIKHLAFSLADMDTLDTDLAFINNY
jgi:DNA repair ATPase RecN